MLIKNIDFYILKYFVNNFKNILYNLFGFNNVVLFIYNMNNNY